MTSNVGSPDKSCEYLENIMSRIRYSSFIPNLSNSFSIEHDISLMNNCQNILFERLLVKDPEGLVHFLFSAHTEKPSTLNLSKLLTFMVECTNEAIVQEISEYLDSLLEKYSPCTVESRHYYKKAIFAADDYNIWDYLSSHICLCFRRLNISSSFTHLDESYEYKGKNYLPLLKFVINVGRKELENYFATKESATKYPHAILSSIFQPEEGSGSCPESFLKLIDYIDCILSTEITHKRKQLFDLLKKIFVSGIECASIVGFQEMDPFIHNHSKFLTDVLEHISKSSNILKDIESFELFLADIDLPWFKLFLCYNILNKIWFKSDYHLGYPILLDKVVSGLASSIVDENHSATSEEHTPQPLKRKRSEGNGKLYKKSNTESTNNIHKLCAANKGGSIAQMLENNVDINELDENRQTPLHVACRYGSDMAIVMLLKSKYSKGIDVYAKDSGGNTALHLACMYNHREAVERLLETGDASLATIRNSRNLLPIESTRNNAIIAMMKKFMTEKSVQDMYSPNTSTPPKDHFQELLCLSINELKMFLFCFITMAEKYLKVFPFRMLASAGGHEEVMKSLQAHFISCNKCKYNLHYVKHFTNTLNAINTLNSDVTRFLKNLKESYTGTSADFNETVDEISNMWTLTADRIDLSSEQF